MSDTAPASQVLARLEETRTRREEYYRHLHAHPELSHQEHATAASVAERLRESGYDVSEGVGGTGVVGILTNGKGQRVLLRADMDALPIKEASGVDYASTVTATTADGAEVPVAHSCGHDVHVTCLLEAADLLAGERVAWSGTLVVLFQPAEELGDGARAMVSDGLSGLVGQVDVAMGQHVLGFPAGTVATRAVLEVNTRTYSEATRESVLVAIERIVRAECTASGSPREPELEYYDRFPATVNDPGPTAAVRAAFEEHFGDAAGELPLQSASEDFSDIPVALDTPYTYWGIGGVDPEEYARAEAVGRVDQDVPVNHSPAFAPVVRPTLDVGTRALVVAALAHLT